MNLTDHGKNQLVAYLATGAAAPDLSGGLYLALFTTATTDAGGGTEVVGGSYARQLVSFDFVATDGEVENDAAVTFTNLPAVTATHGAYFDAASGGNMWAHDAFASSKTFTLGQNYTFAIGDLILTFA